MPRGHDTPVSSDPVNWLKSPPHRPTTKTEREAVWLSLAVPGYPSMYNNKGQGQKSQQVPLNTGPVEGDQASREITKKKKTKKTGMIDLHPPVHWQQWR